MGVFNISGDISQLCDGTEITYYRLEPAKMVVNVFNASASCNITATLKNAQGTVLVTRTINHRVNGPNGEVVNQQKTLAAQNVVSLTISCTCDPSIGSCNVTSVCSGRYEGQVEF